MSLILNLEKHNPKSQDRDIPEIEFLKSSELCDVVTRGLTELYKVQPKTPVTFLANWLMNESRSKEILKRIEENKITKAEIEHSYNLEQERLKKIEEEEFEKLLKENAIAEGFINKIKNCTNFWKSFNDICEELKNVTKSTGVYLSIYDNKRKFPVTEDDDEFAHIVEGNKVLRYIHWCHDHNFLERKYLELGSGVTYDLFIPKEDQPNIDAKPQDEIIDVSETSQVKEEIKRKYITDVVSENAMKFFREPRLGCYLALDLTYKSSLNSNSLLSAIENMKEFKMNKEQQDERRRAYEERVAQIEKERQANSSEMANSNQEVNEPIASIDEPIESFNEQTVQIADYLKEEKKLILSLDTIGQDREYTENEMNYIMLVAQTIKETLENHERTLLEKDRDARMEYDQEDKIIKEMFPIEKQEQDEEKHVKEYFSSEKYIEMNITEEKLKNTLGEFERTRYMITQFFEDSNMKKLFIDFNKFEFVEFERLFQNILYFAFIPNTLINEKETNKLDWFVARNHWNEEILEKLRDYNPFGPKPEKIQNVFKGNRILANLESLLARKEEIREYSFVMNRIMDFLLLILKIRRDDIIKRRDEVTELINERKQIIEENEMIDAEREIALEQARSAATVQVDGGDNDGSGTVENPPTVVEFNEEEFLKEYDEKHAKKEVPPEPVYDEDNDFDLEF